MSIAIDATTYVIEEIDNNNAALSFGSIMMTINDTTLRVKCRMCENEIASYRVAIDADDDVCDVFLNVDTNEISAWRHIDGADARDIELFNTGDVARRY